MVRGFGRGSKVATVAQDSPAMREGADHQRVPTGDDLGVEQRLLALIAMRFELLLQRRKTITLLLGQIGRREVQNVFLGHAAAMMRVGEIRTLIDAVDGVEQLRIVMAEQVLDL